jgi:L-lactate dehydrogenase (cytochrome)/(S)-mandelate dehydrogenase
MAGLKTFEAWQAGAKRRLPKFAFDFADGGADDEVTLRRNQTAFDDLALIPRVLRGVENASAEVVDLFGRHLALPVLLAPTGDSRILGPQAELAQARGASAAGTISILSGVASMPPDRVAAAVPEPGWAQVFLYRDRQVTQQAVEHVKRLGFSALVLTVDGPVKGNRERDIRNGFQLPLKPTPTMALRNVRHWKWMWDYFTTDPKAGPVDPGLAARIRTVLAARHQQPLSVPAVFHVDQSWEDLEWLRSVWEGPLLLKGVMCGQDADLAVAAGCDGVIVSNHGGRELDGSPASIEVLPEVVAAVGGRAQVLVDGGIRRGTDVVKALSLGATACLVGRPWLFALAVAGAEGVHQMLEQLRSEILHAMQLVGVTSVDQLGPDYIRLRSGTGWEPVPNIGLSNPTQPEVAGGRVFMNAQPKE